MPLKTNLSTNPSLLANKLVRLNIKLPLRQPFIPFLRMNGLAQLI